MCDVDDCSRVIWLTRFGSDRLFDPSNVLEASLGANKGFWYDPLDTQVKLPNICLEREEEK